MNNVFIENEGKSNRLLINVCWAGGLFLYLSFLGNRFVNANSISYTNIFTGLALISFYCIISEIWYFKFYKKGKFTKPFKYYLVLILVLSTFHAFYVSKDPYILALYFFPIIAATIYYNNKLILFSVALNFLSITILIGFQLIDMNFKANTVGFYTDIFASLIGIIFILLAFSKKSTNIVNAVYSQEEYLRQVNKELNEQQEELISLNQTLTDSNKSLEKAYHDLNQARVQLFQQDKMASLGQLAAGVAHEINTPVGAINCNTDVIKNIITLAKENISSAENEKLNELLVKLEGINQVNSTACERITKIVKSLRNFARLDDQDVYTETDINNDIENTLVLLNNKFKDRVEIIKDYAQLPAIKCCSGEINQVLMNLLVNASDALSGSGRIWIKTYQSDNMVFISIKDNGVGISPENINKIFSPGFTTKGVGVGTGLSLPISYNIIKKHSGKIEFKSEYNKGTEFIIQLPLSS